MARWNSCNVLDANPDARRVWQFDASKFALKGEQTKYPGEPLPAKLVGKDWSSLFQHKLNIALLPPGDVFLRVLHLPKASLEETLGMVELQLEKISPAPVAQVVWTLHVLPNATEGMQTVLVVIAPRNAVEAFLGKLEEQGYIADRLEISFLEQLLSTNITEDGAWVYPDGRGAKNTAVVAWWYGGILRGVNFIVLPPDAVNAEHLRDQLRQMTWAGELDGWLTSPPTWHLVGDANTLGAWETILREAEGTSIKVVAPISAAEIAALTARRAVANPAKVVLLPHEFAVRYRQQFFDRLWIRGALAVALLYCVGVAIYFAALQIQNMRANRVEGELAGISNDYTNTIELKARYDVLKDRSELKFAALDCWQAVANTLPDTMTVDSMNFNEGQKLLMSGSWSGDASAVIDFGENLRRFTNNDSQPFFNLQTSDPLPTMRANTWVFNLELQRTEVTP